MQIIIKTPEQLVSDRTKLVNDLVDLLHKYSRSNRRYLERIKNLRNKIAAIEGKL